MTFGAPSYFWAFALFPFLVAFFIRNESRRGLLIRKLVAARLFDSLAGGVSSAKRRLRFILFLLGFAFLILALTRPRHGFRTEEHKVTGKDVIIAIDTSRSMLANDVTPTRLDRAKLAAEDLITQLHGDRVGLVAFAGTAFLQAPITGDYSAVLDSLHALDSTIIPVGGTDIAEAIRTAVDAFGKGESEKRALVLFTDGEELDEDAVAEAKKLNGTVRIFTVGLGTAEGTIIALPGPGATEYVKSPQGEIVKSRLDEPRLRAIAEASGGFYVHLTSGPAEMQQIISQGLSSIDPANKGLEVTRRPIERYQWPLGVALILLILSRLPNERRRRPRAAAGALAAALVLLLPLSAFSKNPGVEAYEREDYDKAKETFEKQLHYLPDSDALQFDLGAAAYKTGDLDKALDSFSKATTSRNAVVREKAEYNLGNTLFQRGSLQEDRKSKLQDWENALQHYEEALKTLPQDADARYNRAQVQRKIEEVKKEPPKSQGGQGKEDKDKKDQQESQQQQASESKGSQQKEQQSQEQKGQQSQQSQPQQGQQSQESQQSQSQPGQQGQEKQAQAGQPSKDQQAQQSQQPIEKKDPDGKDKLAQPAKTGQGQPPKEQKDQLAQAEQAQQMQQAGAKKDGEPSPDHKPTGAITDANRRDDQAKKEKDAKEAAADKEAAAAGVMTPSQAAALLDSANDEAHVSFNQRDHQRKDRTLRDW